MSNEIRDRAKRLIDKAAKKCSRCEEVQLYSGYAEPGYSDPESGVIATGNWNAISRWDETTNKSVVTDGTPAKLGHALEKLGVALEWSDEWHSCGQCGKLVRRSPDSYSWKPSYSEQDGEIECHECIAKDPTIYLESLEAEDRHCNTIDSIDPADHKYVLVSEDLQNGWYGGQKADPSIIGSALRNAGITRYLFNLDATGQFDIEFSVYVHKSEGKAKIQKAKDLLSSPTNTDAKEDPADVLSRGLKAASDTPRQEGPGVQYTKINADGTATTRLVSPQEFIDGIKD